MTLVGRLLLFFLAALAFVLIGFSVTLFLLARSHLYRQLDDRVSATLNTLVAAAEIHRRGVEWDVHQRSLSIDISDGTSIVWVIRDGEGKRIDGTEGRPPSILDASNDSPTGREDTSEITEQNAIGTIYWHGQSWRVQRRRLQAGGASAAGAAR